MGEAYLTGIGATKDKDAAKSWFEKAAANGNKKAADSLKALGSAVPQRNEVATDRAATTSDLDSAKACLDEENPGIADGVCRVFVGNTAGLSKPTLAAVFSKLARVSLQLKDYKSALSYSKQALEIAPTAVQQCTQHGPEIPAGLPETRRSLSRDGRFFARQERF
jgi:TPR repeat protein